MLKTEGFEYVKDNSRPNGLQKIYQNAEKKLEIQIGYYRSGLTIRYLPMN